MTKLYPLTFTPVLKDYIWGGRNLEKLGRTLPPGKTAESWEIAAHEDGTAVVNNGSFTGQTLTAVHEALGLDLIGKNNTSSRCSSNCWTLINRFRFRSTPMTSMPWQTKVTS